MPVYYEDTVSDYWHLVNNVTLWDVACERQVQVAGPDAATLVKLLTPRNLSDFKIGQTKYISMVDESGGLLNDPVLLRLEENKFWFSLADYDILLWVKGVAVNAGLDVRITEPDVSPLQIQGPKAIDVVSKLFGEWTKELRYFWFKEGEVEGIPYLLSRTGWSNEKGFEVFLKDSSCGERLWDLIMDAGRDHGIAPGAPSQIKRMEAGLLSYWNDMDTTNNPYEVGLDKFVDLDQDVNFIGKQALKKIKASGPEQRLMGAIVSGDPIPVNGEYWPVLAENSDSVSRTDLVIGKVTSAVYSPSMRQNLVYVMLKTQEAIVDRKITIILPGNDKRNAIVKSLPFTTSKAR
jgi:aminomethyltransferase